MTTHPPSFSTPRRVAALLVGIAALATACGAKRPKVAEPQRVDVSAVDTRRGTAGTTASPEAVQPLFLIDGKKASKAEMERLAPAAIASVDVIKGPAATAQFGAEGVNGVVIITTKR